jgi:CheY-like chemotaxis protein
LKDPVEQHKDPVIVLQGKKILLVEDDEISQFLMKKVMGDWNILLTIVPNGIEALELVKDNDYDVILMDIEMPVMSGIEATIKIRTMRDPRKSHIPIIGLSANPFDEGGEKYIQFGMNDFILKPVTEEDLYNKVYKNIISLIDFY